MNRKLVYPLMGWCLLVVSWACNKPFTSPVGTTPPIPKTSSTPVCGLSAPISLVAVGGVYMGANYSQTNPPTGSPFEVIRSAADWAAFWACWTVGGSVVTPPAPPVDFATQMLVVVVNYGICPLRNASITNVCEDGTQVQISVKDPNHGSYNAMCAGPFQGDTATAVAVNNSSLPVTWTVDTSP